MKMTIKCINYTVLVFLSLALFTLFPACKAGTNATPAPGSKQDAAAAGERTSSPSAQPAAAQKKPAATEVAEPGEILPVLVEKQLLETEIKLANTDKLYFLFNFQEPVIQVKSRGVVLRDWPVASCRFLGHARAIEALPLIAKTTLFAPKREEIKPPPKKKDGEEENEEEKKTVTAPKFDALELPDMPSIYTIKLENNFYIYIRVQPEGFLAGLNFFRLSLKWYFFPPLATTWNALTGRPYTAVDIVLKNKEDAKALFWTFSEQCMAIIIPPAAHLLPFPAPSPSPTPNQTGSAGKKNSTANPGVSNQNNKTGDSPR